jgi:hypothetical protein
MSELKTEELELTAADTWRAKALRKSNSMNPIW